MSNETINYRGTNEQVQQIITGFIRTLAGHGSVGQDLAHGCQLAIAGALLSEIEQAFITKSHGGTGSDGIKWKPLARATIAQRRIGKGDLSAIGIKGAGQPKSRVRGLLTKAQDKEWRRIFAQTKARMMAKFGMGEGEASARAGQVAWAALKAQGAKTKLEVLGGRQVDILRDTGELLASFSQGADGKPSGADGQIARITAGAITVGTNKKTWHHNTRAAWRRPFWPDSGELPASWWKSIELRATSVIPKAVAQLIRNGSGGA